MATSKMKRNVQTDNDWPELPENYSVHTRDLPDDIYNDEDWSSGLSDDNE